VGLHGCIGEGYDRTSTQLLFADLKALPVVTILPTFKALF
jgi:hypothetical protein